MNRKLSSADARRRRLKRSCRASSSPARPIPHVGVRRPAGRPGFTLVELMVVVVIIGIILSLVLIAGMDAANRARERATQALITKLEGGLSDRLEALLLTRPDYNAAHLALANVYLGGTSTLQSLTRAQVIAWYDYVKSEVPDVFVYSQADPDYPLNFAANPYPTVNTNFLCTPYVLPLGQGDNYDPQLTAAGTGVYGASYQAAAGIYKNLGYHPKGYDGVDNDGNGKVDEAGEGVDASNSALVTGNLTNHKHVTARSEMLYALLIEGRGPLGSVFSLDEFSNTDIQDTDGDGLPEFVDAWGQPLQFYRWPLFYHSDIQRGQIVATTSATSWTVAAPSGAPYASVYETREQDALDPNQQLMAPAWWFLSTNASFPLTISNATPVVPAASGGVQAFQTFFHALTEPVPYSSSYFQNFWDRSTTTTPAYGLRRAFYSKFLIVSSGPDQLSGIFRYPDSSPPTASQLVANENNALPFSVGSRLGMDVADFTANASIPTANTSIVSDPSLDPTQPSTSDLIQAAQDDISNQNLATTGGLGRLRMNRHKRINIESDTVTAGAGRESYRRGFTLIELLVVVTIVLIVSAVALPTVLPALAHRQVGEAARLIQAVLAGARDAAVRDNSPSGVRLIPDPSFSGVNPTTLQLDHKLPLAYNRIVPIESAPAYSEGLISTHPTWNYFSLFPTIFPSTAGPVYTQPTNVLVLEETPGFWQFDSVSSTWHYLPYPPTSWFWNIRVGDKVQINNSGPWYTVIGPMFNGPAAGNSEMFVNVGVPGAPNNLSHQVMAIDGTTATINPEYLFLVNGVDDNGNGWVDEEWDGVDNNNNGLADGSDPSEWVEPEKWFGSLASTALTGFTYTIQRRPTPTINAREISLPSGVVIDATTWGETTQERTRFPSSAFSPAGYIDLLVNPDGSVVPTTIYSSPSSVSFGAAFFHFWLAERGDVYGLPQDSNGNPVPLVTGYPFYLPMPLTAFSQSSPTVTPTPNAYSALVATNQAVPYIKGELRIVTLFTRTGQTTSNDNPTFNVLNVNQPFLEAQQGVLGEQQ